MTMHKRESGFTLIEILLVMVIISIIIYASVSYVQQQALNTRINRTAAQMQQIMNAALAFYVDNGRWPTLTELQGVYLPTTALVNGWGNPYNAVVFAPTTSRNFWLATTIPAPKNSASAAAAANIIAGYLPLSYTTSARGAVPPAGTPCSTGSCTVVAQITPPGANLNNATAVNFAGVYHHGGCVPVPSCPADATGTQMKPQIMVVPVSVSGVNDPNSTNIYPISSFTAYAVGNNGTDTPTNKTPPPCTGSTLTLTPNCSTSAVNDANVAAYWRVCLQVVTSKGDVQVPTRTDTWGQYVTLMAVTRCAIINEPAGSNFNVFNSAN